MKDRMKLVRREMGLTQADLAARIDVSVASVQNWESGRKPPSREHILLLATMSGKSPEWLGGESFKPVLLDGYDFTPVMALDAVRVHLINLTSELEEAKAENQRLREQLEKQSQSPSQPSFAKPQFRSETTIVPDYKNSNRTKKRRQSDAS